MVLTDYFNQFYMDADKAIRGGNDLMLSPTGGQNAVITDNSATSVIAMRQASVRQARTFCIRLLIVILM